MRSLIFPSKLMLDLSLDHLLIVSSHYPLANSLAGLVENRVATRQRSSWECAQAFEQAAALTPCWAYVSWHLVPVLIFW